MAHQGRNSGSGTTLVLQWYSPALSSVQSKNHSLAGCSVSLVPVFCLSWYHRYHCSGFSTAAGTAIPTWSSVLLQFSVVGVMSFWHPVVLLSGTPIQASPYIQYPNKQFQRLWEGREMSCIGAVKIIDPNHPWYHDFKHIAIYLQYCNEIK